LRARITDVEPDGSVRIAWQAEGYVAIHVYARFWPAKTVGEFARGVADVALTNRSVHDLRRALRALFPGEFEMEAPDADAPDRRVRISFHPPRGEPNPDPA
jgi:hypothetical protein